MSRPTILLDYPVLDCPDPTGLAQFYAEVLGWNVVRSEDDWAVLQGPGEQRLAFQLAPDFEPVDWPTDGVGVHLDFIVDDWETTKDWVLDLGADLVEDATHHPGFRVFRDPAGHYFCLCRRGQ
jgi:predicted enzyme related to lactoylglutathione lyase